jgi:hypothetical protein
MWYAPMPMLGVPLSEAMEGMGIGAYHIYIRKRTGRHHAMFNFNYRCAYLNVELIIFFTKGHSCNSFDGFEARV